MRIRFYNKRTARVTPERASAEVLESRLHLSAAPAHVAVAASAPPVAPTSLAAGHAGPGEIRLAWTDRSADETGFIVSRRRAEDATFTQVAELPADTRGFLDVPDPVLFPAGTVLQYQVFAFNDAGASSPSTTFQGVTVGGAGGTGLRQRIWNDLDPASFEPLGAPAIDAVDPWVNHAWGDGPPAPGIDPDTFAVEWVGEIVADQTKAYDFSVIANDGVRLFLNDKLVIAGGWRDQPDTEYFSEPLLLTAGQKVKVRLQSYDNTGPATVQLRWNGSVNNSREPIPSVFLFPTVGANDTVANIASRAATFPEVFLLPPTETAPLSIALRWQDNAFGESGYEIERATNGTFTENKVRFVSPRGRDLFVDRGGTDADGNPAPLEYRRYYYRLRPTGAAAFVFAGDAHTHPDIDPPYEVTLPSFASPEKVTLNGYASTTAEGTLKLTHNQNDRISSAFVNRSFNVDRYFREARFDFRIGESNGADGMTFVIHNAAPSSGMLTQLNALGGGNGRMGYGGIPNSVAIVFDFFNQLDAIGVFTQGLTVDGTWEEIPAGFKRDNSNPATVHQPNGLIDLRNTANLTPGTAAINIDGGAVFRVNLSYDSTGVDANGNGAWDEEDTGLLTIELENMNAPGPILFKTQFAVDLAQEVGGDTAVMGWTAATGGLNARMEVYNFDYKGMHGDPIPISEVYVRSSEWLGQDNNPATTHFMEYLESKGLGDDIYGYRLFGNGAPTAGPAANPENILPWINPNQLVVRYAAAPSGSGVPTPGSVTLTGLDPALSSYSVMAVTPVAGDPTAFVLTLNKPLGGGNPTTGVAPTSDENGDYIKLELASGGPAGGNFSLQLKVLQGDPDHLDETSSTHAVLARDFAEVKRRFFKNTTSAVVGDGADYTPFHDVDGSGSILARDFAEVKKRFFQDLPAPPFSSATPAAAVPPMFASRRDRPAGRSALRELLA